MQSPREDKGNVTRISLENATYLSHRPSAHDFTYAADPAELFQIIRLNYGGVYIQIVTHRVMATWKFTSTNTVCESDGN